MSLKTTTSISLPILNKLPFVNIGDDEAESDDEGAGKPKALGAGSAAAVKKAAAAAASEMLVTESVESPGGQKKRGSFVRKTKAAPPQSSKRSPSPAATRSGKAMSAKKARK